MCFTKTTINEYVVYDQNKRFLQNQCNLSVVYVQMKLEISVWGGLFLNKTSDEFVFDS